MRARVAHVTTTTNHTPTRTHKKSLYYAVRDKSHDDLALLTCLLYATSMRFFKHFQRALDAFLAPDDNPVRSSHAIDAGRGTPSIFTSMRMTNPFVLPTSMGI